MAQSIALLDAFGSLLRSLSLKSVAQATGDAIPIVPDSDGDYTLSEIENLHGRLTLTNGAWTTGHSIILDNTVREITIDNSAGSYAALVKTAAGTGIAIPAGIEQKVYNNGTNVVPNGSIVEIGSNANGSYTKFADGTVHIIVVAPNTASIPANQSFGVAMTLPITLIAAADYVVGHARPLGSADVYGFLYYFKGGSTTTMVNTTFRNGATAQAFTDVGAFVIGRWK